MSQISQTTPFKKKAPLKVFGGRLHGNRRSDLSDNTCDDLKPESFDTLACRMCSTKTKPKSVSVSTGNKVSVSYQCPFCDSSWRINDAGKETHFRQGAKKLICA